MDLNRHARHRVRPCSRCPPRRLHTNARPRLPTSRSPPTVRCSSRFGSAASMTHSTATSSSMRASGLDGEWNLVYDGYGKGAWQDGASGRSQDLLNSRDRFGNCSRPPACGSTAPIRRSRSSIRRNQGILPMRIFHTTSTDGGRTWSPRRRMDVRPHLGASPVTEAIISLPNGVLAQPYETWKEFHDDGPPDQGAYFRLSGDGGRTWPDFATMAKHPSGEKYYWDVRLARHPENGRFVGTYWTHDPTLATDVDIHISWGSPDGTSWTEPLSTGVSGQHCMPISLGGDRVLFVYPDRRKINGIGASLSDDFGRDLEHSAAVDRLPQRRGRRVRRAWKADPARTVGRHDGLEIRPSPRRPAPQRRDPRRLLRWRRKIHGYSLGTHRRLEGV